MNSTKTVKHSFCTTKEAADLLGISLRTAQLWSESGLLEAWKTTGGHRRISRESVERLLAGDGVAESHGRPEPGSPGRLQILIVEDDASLARLYQLNLGKWDISPVVRIARNGIEGLVQLGAQCPDLLITDLSMPGMDGFHMIRSLRRIMGPEELRIIVVSGLDMDDIRAAGGLPPDVPVLGKPVPFARLRSIAEEILTAKATEAGRRQL